MSMETSLSSSSPLYVHQITRLVADLTGRVLKTEPYSFAYGGHGDIWKAILAQKDTENPLKPVAIKVIKGLGLEDAITKRFVREICIWSTLNHPNITSLLGVVSDFDRPGTPCLVSPYYRNGDIRKYIKNHPGANKFVLISQVVSALEYLHGQSVVHGDIKPSNILVNDKGEASINDFGLSRILDTTGFTTIASGTLRYAPPELAKICEEEEFNPSMAQGWRGKAPERMVVSPDESTPRVTKATDVWEFGMTVLEILAGAIPFWYIQRDASVINYIVSGGRPQHKRYHQIDNETWKMLEGCWNADPIQRPSMAFFSIFLASRVVGRARL